MFISKLLDTRRGTGAQTSGQVRPESALPRRAPPSHPGRQRRPQQRLQRRLAAQHGAWVLAVDRVQSQERRNVRGPSHVVPSGVQVSLDQVE